jgi:hypothetical protein
MDKLYAIKLDKVGKFNCKKVRYIAWCNDRWYETTDDPTPKFTYEQVKDIIENIKNHYVTKLTVINQDGVLDPIDILRRSRLTRHDIPIKKSLLNLNGMVFKSKKNNYFK